MTAFWDRWLHQPIHAQKQGASGPAIMRRLCGGLSDGWIPSLLVVLLSADNDPSLAWYFGSAIKSWNLEKRHGNRRNSDGVMGDQILLVTATIIVLNGVVSQ
jgi:hypothetical protein